MRIANVDTLLGGLFTAVGGVFLYVSYRDSATVFVLPGDAPPFLVPQLYLYVWLALSVALFIGGILGGGDAAPLVNWKRLFVTISWLVFCGLLMWKLGFLVAGIVGTIGTCWLLGCRRMWLAVVVAVIVTVGVELMLTNMANLPLPTFPGMRF